MRSIVVFLLCAVATAQNTIVDVASGAEQFSSLVQAVVQANLVDLLSSDGPFTVFAPTNEAFAKVPGIETLLTDDSYVDTLGEILSYHVLTRRVDGNDLDDGDEFTTAQGDELEIETTLGFNWRNFRFFRRVFVEHVRVTDFDIEASNGLIHTIEEVLLPEGIVLPVNIVEQAEQQDLSRLVSALESANLTDTLEGDGPFTVFAPTNEAFAKLPFSTQAWLLLNPDELETILLYHVIAGAAVPASQIVEGSVREGATVEGSNLVLTPENGTVAINGDEALVKQADVPATNGIIHVIDTVLIPPDLELPQTIADLAASTDDLSTLAAALEATDLDILLNFTGPYTVFAPSNAAFAEIQATVDDLLANDLDTLRDILNYHVVFGPQLLAEDIVANDPPFSLFTLNLGEELIIDVTESGQVTVEDATVTTADVKALNGVVHIIDKVLMPPERESCPFWPIVCRLLNWIS